MSEENSGGEKGKGIVYKESNPKLVAAVNKLIARDENRYTQGYIAAQAGVLSKRGSYTSSYVCTWLKGRFTNDDWELAVAAWLDQEAAEHARRARKFFGQNPISQQITQWLDFARNEGRVVAITGDPGIGKTETVDHCMEGKRGVFRIQASSLRNSAKHMMYYLRDTIGATHHCFDIATNPADGIVRYFLEFGHMIVVDDFDLLIPSAYEFLLRDLWNQTRLGNKTVPMLWLGNEEGIQRIRRLSPQLRSRLLHKPIIADDCFKAPFIRALMEHHLEEIAPTPAMVNAGVKIANLPGTAHLRTLTDLCVEVRHRVRQSEEDAEDALFDVWEDCDDRKALAAVAPKLLAGIRPPPSASESRRSLTPAELVEA